MDISFGKDMNYINYIDCGFCKLKPIDQGISQKHHLMEFKRLNQFALRNLLGVLSLKSLEALHKKPPSILQFIVSCILKKRF